MVGMFEGHKCCTIAHAFLVAASLLKPRGVYSAAGGHGSKFMVGTISCSKGTCAGNNHLSDCDGGQWGGDASTTHQQGSKEVTTGRNLHAVLVNRHRDRALPLRLGRVYSPYVGLGLFGVSRSQPVELEEDPGIQTAIV